MRIEKATKQYRVWLAEKEREQLVNHYGEDIIRQVAIRLMVDGGLRSEEVPRVCVGDLEPSSEGFTRLKVREGKTGDRETVIPQDLADRVRMIAQARDVNKYDPIIQKTPRTIQNWVSNAAEALAEENNERDWKKVSAHDLRRTWATDLVQSGIPSDLVMDWGGWEDHSTFREHYWQESDEAVAKHLERIEYI